MAESYDLDGGMEGTSKGMAVVEELEKLKAKGSSSVSKKDYKLAILQYDKIFEVMKKETEALTADYDAERQAEKVALAARNNKALCALKLEDWAMAKVFCAEGLESHKNCLVPDPSGKAKLLFRRGQAQLGGGDARAAVDSMAEALEIEEKLLGVSNKDAALKSDENDKQKIATIGAIKKELLKARKAMKAEDQRTKENFKGARGFLDKKSGKNLTDPKQARNELYQTAMDRVLASLFDDDLAAQTRTVERHLKQINENLPPNQDIETSARRHFIAGFLTFLKAELANNPEAMKDVYATSAAHFDACWNRRSEIASQKPTSPDDEGEEKEDPFYVELDLDEDSYIFGPLNKICALESTGHSMMRANQLDPARAYLVAFAEKALSTECPALHNLPDSFLLQKGYGKMDKKKRTAYRWKHRSHQNKAIFDAYSATASASRDLMDRATAIDVMHKALSISQDDLDIKRAGHNNLAFLYAAKWKDYENTPIDADVAAVHSTLSLTFKTIKEQEDAAKKTKEAKLDAKVKDNTQFDIDDDDELNAQKARDLAESVPEDLCEDPQVPDDDQAMADSQEEEEHA